MAGIAHDEKLENLLMLSQGEDASSSFTVTNLPTNAEAVTELPQNMATEAIDKLNDRTQEADINEMHVAWSDTTGRYSWLLGCV